MTSLLDLFGFPPPEKRDSVKFLVAKNLAYNTRLNLMLFLFVIGFGLQILFMNPIYGAPLILTGILLVLVRGYDSRIRLKTFSIDPNWKTVPIEKIQEIEKLRQRNRKWDRDALDISNPLGSFSLIFFGGLAVVLAFVLGSLTKDSRVTLILVTDTILLAVPLWLSGMRFILKQPNLAIRVHIILKLYEEFQGFKEEGEEFKPALMLATKEEKGTVPTDVRFSIVFPDSPEGFYGLQAQINLNVVQGNSYPYFYGVLAAKPGFGLYSYRDKIKLGKGIICEFQKDQGAEVLVIRQDTSKKTGYYTKDQQCTELLEVAILGGRLICQSAAEKS